MKKLFSAGLLLAFIFPFLISTKSYSKEIRDSTYSSVVIHPKWSRNATIYEINERQFSKEGTFRAIIPQLPRLKKMGVKIIWLMPINPIGKKNRKGPLGSYYSVQNYLKVNPHYGTLSDLKALVNAIHKEGMYVIIDWVANHTSWDNVLTKTHPDWYKHDKNGNFVPPVKDWTDVIKLDYSKPGLRHYMINAMKYWVKTANIDGFRCDVASMVPIDFWVQARKALDKMKPVFMLAEAESPKMHRAFDMTYGWNLYHLFNDIAAGKKNASDIQPLLKKENQTYPRDAYRMLFTSNHDENSWNGTVFERLKGGVKTFAVLTATMNGMPLVYDGQEAGMHKRLKFFQKDPIVWRKSSLSGFYTKLLHLKEDNKALLNGDEGGKLKIIHNDKPKAVFSFVREKDKQKVVVITNLTDADQNVRLQSESMKGAFKNLFTGREQRLRAEVTMNLKPWEYIVLEK